MRILSTAVLCTALATPVLAQAPAAPGAWVHVRVQEAQKSSSVAVNLPLSVVQAVVQAAPDKIVADGKVQFNDEHKMRVADLKKAWRELGSAGDAELVSVQDEDEKVSIRRSAGKLLVNVDKTASREQVRIEIPATVVDAFFSASGDEVNVKAALDALAHIRGDLVTVDDSNSSVRIWIDEKP
jgi:hypothetical protein